MGSSHDGGPKSQETPNIDPKPPEARGEAWDRFLLRDTDENLPWLKLDLRILNLETADNTDFSHSAFDLKIFLSYDVLNIIPTQVQKQLY